MVIGELVKQRRVAKGLTQAELAQKTGLRQTYISQVEKGEIAMPRDHNLDTLGRELGITRAEFYREAGYLEDVVPPDQSDAFDRAPLSRLVAALHDIAGFDAQLDQLASQTPHMQDVMIRRLARRFRFDLEDELQRLEEGE